MTAKLLHLPERDKLEPVEAAINRASEAKLERVLILGWRDGETYCTGNIESGPEAVFLLEWAKALVMRQAMQP